ncbi:MAG TPA: DMT family transporter [Gemmatimonadaceae bacterium]|nr:DMT family transporter [Gemmatimonadaceae bacterium]
MATLSVGRATVLVAFSACCFGSIAILVTLATRAGARLSEVLAWRFLIAALLLAIVAGGPSIVRREARRGVPLIVLAGGGQAAIGALSLGALRYIPAATMIFLFYTYPAWVTVISAMRGKEALTGRRLLALLLSLAGIGVMVGVPGTGASSVATPGVLLALAGALLYALYIPMINHLGRELPPALTATYATTGAGIILTVFAAMTGGFARQPASVWLTIVLLAVLCTVIAFTFFLRGLAALGPVRTAIVSTVEPFWGALLGALVLAQPLAARTLTGGALVAAAVVILNLPQRVDTPVAA